MTSVPAQADLLLAWKLGDLASFKAALKEDGVKPNFVYPEEGYQTLLETIAVSVSPISGDFASALINAGAMVNLMNSISGKAPLHVAAQELNTSVMEVLIKGGADINVLDSAGNTPLHIVARKVKTEKDENCLNLLLNAPGIELNHQNRKGFTPVQIAFQFGMKNALKIFLEQGSLIDVDSIPPGGNKRSIREEILEKYPDLIEELPPRAPPEWVLQMDGPSLFNLLYMGEEKRFCSALKKALEDKSQHSLLTYDDGQQTFLQYAVKMGLIEAADTLLQYGANVNESGPLSASPLRLACLSGNLDMLKLILTYQPDLSPDINGDTALHTIIRHRDVVDNKIPCLEKLLHTKIDINHTNNHGRTALHYAVLFPHSEAIRLLLANGANMFIEDDRGDSPCRYMTCEELEEFLDAKLFWNYNQGDSCGLKMDLNFLNPNSRLSVVESEGNMLDDVCENSFKLKTEAKYLSQIAETPHLLPLLAHPVIKAFISHKWTLIRAVFYAELILYFFFALFLLCYVLNTSQLNGGPSAWKEFVRIILIILLIVRYLQSILAAAAGPYAFSKNPQRWTNFVLTIMATIVVNSCNQEFPNYCRTLVTATILLTGFHFLLLIGEHPRFSLSFAIMKTLSRRCMFVILAYSAPLLAFAVCWHTLSNSRVGPPIDNAHLSQGLHVVFCFLFLVISTHLFSVCIDDCRKVMMNKDAHSLREQINLVSSLEETFISSPRARLTQLVKYTHFDIEMPAFLEKITRKILFFSKGDGYLVVLNNDENKLVTLRQNTKKRSIWNPTSRLPRRFIFNLEKKVLKKVEAELSVPEVQRSTTDDKVDVLVCRFVELSKQLEGLNDACKQMEQLLIQSLAVLSLHNSQT